MKTYNFIEHKSTHLINVAKISHSLLGPCALVFDIVGIGKKLQMIDTKCQASEVVASTTIEAQCHYVNITWLGGMLTNLSTTKMRLHKFKDLNKEHDTT